MEIVSKKRFWMGLLGYFFLIWLLILGLSVAEYRSYTRQCNEKIGGILGVVSEKYPEITKEELVEILDGKAEKDADYFAQYYIDLEEKPAILENEKIFRKYLFLTGLVVLMGSSGIFLLFLFQNRSQKQLLRKVSGILQRINRGDYHYQMDENEEGEWSILESEIYKTTIMLREAAEQSRRDKERLKESLSDISHQLKTPLTSLSINLENLEDSPGMEEEKRLLLLGHAKRDVNRMRQMVQQLLTLSKLDANVIEFKKEETTLLSLVKEAMESVSALAELKEIVLSQRNEKEASATVLCDTYWEKQALTNLLKNAIEHAEKNVWITYKDCELYKEITIENDGREVSERDRKNLFKRYYSGENATPDSMGIGLSLADAVIKKDGGYIVAEFEETTKMIIRYL